MKGEAEVRVRGTSREPLFSQPPQCIFLTVPGAPDSFQTLTLISWETEAQSVYDLPGSCRVSGGQASCLAPPAPVTWPCSDTRPPSCPPDPPSSHSHPEAQVDAISLLPSINSPTAASPHSPLKFQKMLVVMLITQSTPIPSAL